MKSEIKKPSVAKKVLGVAIAAVVGIGIGIGGTLLCTPAPVIPEPVIEYVNQTVVEYVNQTVVEVENEDMAIVSEYMEDMLNMDEPIAEIKALYVARDLALEVLETPEFADMLEDEDIIVDEDDFNLVRVYAEDLSDIVIVEADFDDGEYEFVIKAKVEDEEDEVKFKVNATIKVEDGKAELISVLEI